MTLYQIKLRFLRHKKHIKKYSQMTFWFLTGATLALFFFLSFSFLFFQKMYENKIYPGVMVNNVNFGGKDKSEVQKYFDKKNDNFSNTKFSLTSDFGTATVSAQELDFGYNSKLLADQAYLIGRGGDIFSNISLILQGYISGINLSPSYSFCESKLESKIKPLSDSINKNPVNALFTFSGGRVTAFQPSENGQAIDNVSLNKIILDKAQAVAETGGSQTINITVPIKTIEPQITTDKVNNMGIRELIGEGTSLFQHSIPSRVYNISLGTSKFNGILVAPDEIFSFDKVLGDVSSLTGYKQAYVIQNGKTVLGDGGGICQVSTTFFRALLNAGLPITERYAHAYRVGYYEQDMGPGFDATIYVPTVDLKFKNDTGHYILIQTAIDYNTMQLSFFLYGTKDGREVSISKPVVTNETPPPPDLYQDDPTLPKGEVKQVDFAAWGADVYFTRVVKKNGKVIISDKFVSDYRPWQAVYLRGTM